jgi:E3 ubiquitin-protein ligase RNF14
MEQRYGKKQLQALVDTSLSENWLSNNSKKCPSCNAAIEVISRVDLR